MYLLIQRLKAIETPLNNIQINETFSRWTFLEQASKHTHIHTHTLLSFIMYVSKFIKYLEMYALDVFIVVYHIAHLSAH